MLRRLIPGAVVGVIASLAFAGSALAQPTAPQLAPIPPAVCGPSVNVSWTASTPDVFANVIAYRVDVGDLTTGTASYKYVNGLSTTIGGLALNHHYVLRVRALELGWFSHQLTYSSSSADTFVRSCLRISDDVLNRYVAYNPWPGCIMCGLLDFYSDDPVMQREIAAAIPPAAEKIRGVQLAADGSAQVIGG
jgi:hypothetical protein